MRLLFTFIAALPLCAQIVLLQGTDKVNATRNTINNNFIYLDANKAGLSHVHVIGDVTGLQDALDSGSAALSIPDLTATTTRDDSADYAVIWSAAASAMRRIKLVDLFSGLSGGGGGEGGAGLPSGGTVGQVIRNTGSGTGAWQNDWTAHADGTIEVDTDAHTFRVSPSVIPQLTGENEFSGLNTFTGHLGIPVVAALVTADCDTAEEAAQGRVVILSTAPSGSKIHLCEDNSGTIGWVQQ